LKVVLNTINQTKPDFRLFTIEYMYI